MTTGESPISNPNSGYDLSLVENNSKNPLDELIEASANQSTTKTEARLQAAKQRLAIAKDKLDQARANHASAMAEVQLAIFENNLAQQAENPIEASP